MATALVMTLVLHQWPLFGGSAPVAFAKTTLATTGVTTAVWVLVTLLTPPEPDEVLLRFYRKVRPHATGWHRIAALAPELPQTRGTSARICLPGRLAVPWSMRLCSVLESCALGQIGTGSLLLGLATVCALLLLSRYNTARGGDDLR